MYSHSSSITHPFWHQRPNVFSYIFNHPSFLTPTSSCILIHLQSPILSDTNVLMYSHSSSITHPFWHQRPHVFSFIINHSSFLTLTSSRILIHLQSPILSDTNVLTYSHSSSITHPFWHQRPHVFPFIFNHPSFLTPTSSRILIHLQSPILSDTNVLMYSRSSSITHPFWHQRPHVFSFIFNHPSFLTPMSSCNLIHHQSPAPTSNGFYNNLFSTKPKQNKTTKNIYARHWWILFLYQYWYKTHANIYINPTMLYHHFPCDIKLPHIVY